MILLDPLQNDDRSFIGSIPVLEIPDAPKDELVFVTSQGTIYRITNIGLPKENTTE